MTGIYQKTVFDSCHRLLGYDGNCRFCHGHTWMAEFWIEGEKLDKCDMLVDYRTIKNYIKEKWDHRAIFNELDPLVDIFKSMDLKVTTLTGNPTAENIARIMLKDLGAIKVIVHESADNFAEEVAK